MTKTIRNLEQQLQDAKEGGAHYDMTPPEVNHSPTPPMT